MNTYWRRLSLAAGLLAAAWLVPPVMRTARHLCPVRPGGVASASAMPSFSRKYAVNCSQCHAAYPVLNDFGRRFMMNGFVMNGQDTVVESKDGGLRIERLFPWGIVVRSRPFDNGRGSAANAGAWNGGSDNTPGFKMQPLNDADFFVAGGDAAKRVSWIGELDANAANTFTPTIGDMQLGWHPSPYANLILARKNFYLLDPYQTLSGMQSVTVANRATDGLQPDQGSLSGATLTEQTQTIAGYGSAEVEGMGSLFYMAGVTAGSADDRGGSHKNVNFRLAVDDLQGLMLGAFGTFGRERPGNIPAIGAGNPNVPGPGADVQFARAGVDAMYELGQLVARGAWLYSYDHDPASVGAGLTGDRENNRAGYAELMYVFKRKGSEKPFLLPMIRENWYTTFNGTRQFNYVTAHLAHFFRDNLKAFVEYTVDTKADAQSAPAGSRVPRGDRFTAQVEVGF